MTDNKAKEQKMMLYCSICGATFDYGKIALVHKEDAKTIFHTTCAKCKTSTLVMVSENQKGLVGVGILTDLDQEEVSEKIKNGAISSDEIIDTYKVLNI
jgi:hypothetical protein